MNLLQWLSNPRRTIPADLASRSLNWPPAAEMERALERLRTLELERRLQYARQCDVIDQPVRAIANRDGRAEAQEWP